MCECITILCVQLGFLIGVLIGSDIYWYTQKRKINREYRERIEVLMEYVKRRCFPECEDDLR